MSLFANGMFNNVDPIFGIPLYIWEWILNIIFIIILWVVLWYIWWRPYTPLHGLYYAWKDGTPAAFICDKFLVAEMVPERLAKCIFDYSKDEYEIEVPYADHQIIGRFTRWFFVFAFYYPSKHLPNLTPFDAFRYKVGHVNKDVEIAILKQGGEWDRYPSVICGGVPVDIIIDTDNWTLPTSRQHLAIVKSAREWNKQNPTDQVHSYTKYQKYLLAEKIPCPPEIQTGFIVPWTRIDLGFPMDLEENDWAGKRRQMAADRAKDKDSGDKKQMALLVIVGGIAFAALVILARLIVFFLSLPSK